MVTEPVKMPPTEVAINPISAEDVVDAVNFPTLNATVYKGNTH